MKANKAQSNVSRLFHAIAHMVANPIKSAEHKDNLKNHRRELHLISGGGNPVFSPKRKKLKGYQR